MSLKELEKWIKVSKSEDVRGIHIFSNPIRRSIYRELTRLPCRTASSIAIKLGVDYRVVLWHLLKLENSGFVSRWVEHKTYFFVPYLVDLHDLEFFSLLNSKAVKMIIRYIYGGCRMVNEIPVPKSTLYRYVAKLKQMEYVYSPKDSRGYICPSKSLIELIERSKDKGTNFKREFPKLLEYPGFHVRVLGEIDNELKLEVYGIESFTMGVFISPFITSMEV